MRQVAVVIWSLTMTGVLLLATAGIADNANAGEPRHFRGKNEVFDVFPGPPSPSERIIEKGRTAAATINGRRYKAWLADGTSRYGHGVLGDAEEAETLIVAVEDKRHALTLGPDAVFEDLEPRLADIDRDGSPEVIVIKSYLDRGATIALYGVRDGKLVHLAEAEPIGRPNRWLNPAGVADYDGDGSNEIAVIRTPHIGGILIHYGWDGGSRLVPERQVQGYSTHKIGSTVLGMSATADWDGDGVPDLFLPRQDRSVLAIVTAAGGPFRELAAFRHPAELDTKIIPSLGLDELGEGLVYGLTNDEIWHLPFGE